MAQEVGQRSPDGHWVWNGTDWVPNAPIAAPPAPAAVPWARPYESARYRATVLSIFLTIDAASFVLLVCLEVVLIVLGTPTANDTASILVGLLGLVVLLGVIGGYIPTIVFFCMWVHRVVRNMPALGAWDPRWSPAGAVGRCFIPFLNLAHPMSGTLEAWRASDPSRRWTNVAERKAMRVPGLIIGWWALWLIGNFVTNIASRQSSSHDPATAALGDWFTVAGVVLLIGAASLAILVVRDVTARQDRKNELIATGQLA